VAESLTIDEDTPFGARVARHLREGVAVWLTTVAPSGTPTPNPVWFQWDGADRVRVHSLPDAARVRHLATNPRVALHFDDDGSGSRVVVLTGTARPAPELPAADADPAYLARYAEHITRIGHTPASFAAQYSLPVEVTLTGLRGY